MSACSSGCANPGSHQSWGECVRSKKQMIGFAASVRGADKTRDKLWDKELSMYEAARKAGIQPDGTGTANIQFAMDQSEKHGMRYGTDFNVIPDGKGGYDAVSHETVKQVTAMVDKTNDMQVIRETAHGG